MSEKPESSTAQWLGLIAGILGLIAAVLAVGPSLLGFKSFRDMTCEVAGAFCKANPPDS